jgi:protein-S-isoprenylcysteine O-methyltransferase Ste14
MDVSALFRILDLAWIFSEIALLLITRTRSGNPSADIQDRGSLRILWIVIFVAITLGSYYGETRPHTIDHGAPWVRATALTLLLLGLAIRWTAIITLGRSFSANVAIHATQTIHKTGLFRFVRHPSYSGLILIFAAISLHTRNWLGLAIIFIPTTAALFYRIHVEESALRRAFGHEYEIYSKSTKCLIPGIY